jgi:hypothetical protein
MKFKIEEGSLVCKAYAQIDGLWCKIAITLDTEEAEIKCREFTRFFNGDNAVENTTYLEI